MDSRRSITFSDERMLEVDKHTEIKLVTIKYDIEYEIKANLHEIKSAAWKENNRKTKTNISV